MKDLLLSTLRKTFDYKGRATQREFWTWFGLFLALFVGFLIWANTAASGPVVLVPQPVLVITYVWFFAFLLLIPSTLAVGVRRLHDTGHSGLWLLVSFFFTIAFLVVLYWWCLASQPEANKWGEPPAE